MKYTVYRDAKREWRWRLRAKNGKVVAESGEGYRNKKDCLEGIALSVEPALRPVRAMVRKLERTGRLTPKERAAFKSALGG